MRKSAFFGLHLGRRHAEDGIFGLFCYGYSLLAQFIFSYLAIKYVGADGYGIYVAAFVMSTAIVLLGSFCFEYKIIPLFHRLEKEGNADTIPALMISVLFLNFVMAGTIGLALWAFRTPLANTLKMGVVFETTLMAIIPLGIVLALRSTLCGGISAAGKVKWVFFATMILNRSGMLVVVGVLYGMNYTSLFPAHPALLAAGVALAEGASLLFLLLRWYKLSHKEGHFWNTKIDWKLLRQLLYSSLPPFFHNLGGYANSEINKLLIGVFRPSSQVGMFHIVTMMAAIPFLPFQIFVRSYGPMASALYQENDMSGLRRLYQINSLITLSVGMGLTSLLVFWGKYVLRFYGEEFSEAYTPLLIIAFATMLWIAPGPSGNTLYMLEKDRIFYITTFLSIVVNLLGAIFLIPRLGMMGAAYSIATATILRNIVLAVYLYIQTGIHAFNRDMGRMIVSSGVVICLYFVLCTQGLELLAAGICMAMLAALATVFIKPHLKNIMINKL